MEKKVLREVVKYLKQDKISVEAKGKKTQGFVCGTLSLVRSSRPELEGRTPLEKSLTHSWLTYLSTHLFRCSTHEALNTCLQHINKELENRAFLCGFHPTIGDVVLFLALHPFVVSWSFMHKEQYQNLSRWFITVQGDNTLSATHSPVLFSRTTLYGGSVRVH
ncbi:eukaryotic translation elongation factor 1 epsilon-1-like isoform X2 [Eriocheir sinensis]|uniref:eukaryotic translation elongation factor 1 epsilon-1-like isoform X2 n=1 Tax=Eriocheir sinensis TaxID=95602 RepID=UPI0021C8B12D|nr:eukaryotic translation elongation factor 1 epsilon-1-like isoform X2 [Eriocheir sinensis]XP_050696472.1 eukaryotic translation elongation factor 1 epsilon-1-like isoform X2 [Eriocheir sinensis]